eukprot:TRINITY_DN3386_c0_g1_i2.p1 TRINITY_DN3386_c0_g1~~TRINITY_DN3386_c0_g1_i2.p1  ORF type:complete len:111 (+),score=40.08 TRINITY_DN3386_c0_g1_i2:175-507(+)
MVVASDPSLEFGFAQVVQEAEQLFNKICPDQPFFAPPPAEINELGVLAALSDDEEEEKILIDTINESIQTISTSESNTHPEVNSEVNLAENPNPDVASPSESSNAENTAQ